MEFVTSALVNLNSSGVQRLSPLIGYQRVAQNSPLQCNLESLTKTTAGVSAEVGVWVWGRSIGKNGTKGPVHLFIKWAYIDLMVLQSKTLYEGPQTVQ